MRNDEVFYSTIPAKRRKRRRDPTDFASLSDADDPGETRMDSDMVVNTSHANAIRTVKLVSNKIKTNAPETNWLLVRTRRTNKCIPTDVLPAATYCAIVRGCR